MNTIKILAWEPGKSPEIRFVQNQLKDLQGLVGGYIEAVPLPVEWLVTRAHHVVLICNEEGKLRQLAPNRFLPWINDTIAGCLFAVEIGNDGNFTSLRDADIESLKELIP